MPYIFLSFLSILVSVNLLSAQSWVVSGYVTDADDKEALIGATVYCKALQLGTTTNEYGYYSLALPQGKHNLEISYTGYDKDSLLIELNESTTYNISLNRGGQLTEVVVSAEDQNPFIHQRQSIQVDVLEKIPSVLAETDIFKGLALLPGMSIGVEGTSKLYVRGGTPDQNLILLDGVPVYNANHLGGFFSVFNPDAIHNVTVYKGDFPARYGGRLSSVMDIQLKEGNQKELHGKIGLGLLTSQFLLEGPFSSQSSYIISGRSSYLGPALNATQEDGKMNYWLYDCNAKTQFKLPKGKLFFSAYLGNDYGKTTSNSYNRIQNGVEQIFDNHKVDWGNTTLSSRYTLPLRPQLYAKFLAGYTEYRYSFTSTEKKEIFSEKDTTQQETKIKNGSNVQDFIVQAHFDHSLKENHFLRYGAGVTFHHFNNSSGATTSTKNQYRSQEFHVFLEDEWKWSKKWQLDLGVRGSALKMARRWYKAVEPRVSLSSAVSKNVNVRLSYAFNQQYLHLLAKGGFGFPNDIWLPTTSQIPPQQAQQIALHTAISLPRHFRLSIEGYYKIMQGLIEYSHPNIFSQLANWEKLIKHGGKGNSKGIEWLLERKKGKLTGFLAYTLSWSDRTFSDINQGKTYPFSYDRRHDIAIVLNYSLSKKWAFSSTWVFQTGSAVTLPVAEIPNQGGGTTTSIFAGRNNGRMPNYHRLDVGAVYSHIFKNGNIFSIKGSIYNAYHRMNPSYLGLGSSPVFDTQGQYLYSTQDVKQISQWGILPAFSLSFSF